MEQRETPIARVKCRRIRSSLRMTGMVTMLSTGPVPGVLSLRQHRQGAMPMNISSFGREVSPSKFLRRKDLCTHAETSCGQWVVGFRWSSRLKRTPLNDINQYPLQWPLHVPSVLSLVSTGWPMYGTVQYTLQQHYGPVPRLATSPTEHVCCNLSAAMAIHSETEKYAALPVTP